MAKLVAGGDLNIGLCRPQEPEYIPAFCLGLPLHGSGPPGTGILGAPNYNDSEGSLGIHARCGHRLASLDYLTLGGHQDRWQIFGLGGQAPDDLQRHPGRMRRSVKLDSLIEQHGTQAFLAC